MFDSETYKQISSSVYEAESLHNDVAEKAYDPDFETTELSTQEVFDQIALQTERAQEIEHLTHVILCEQPPNDQLAHALMEQLNEIVEAVHNMHDVSGAREFVLSSLDTQASYDPSTNQTGIVADHDRPSADYGHLGRFDLKLSSEHISHLYF